MKISYGGYYVLLNDNKENIMPKKEAVKELSVEELQELGKAHF